jgi:hypothetical protein
MSLRQEHWVCPRHDPPAIAYFTAEVDLKIASLAPEVDDQLRTEMRDLLAVLRDVGYPEGVLSCMMRCGLRFMQLLYATRGKPSPSDQNLFKCIEDAEADGLLPPEIATHLHFVRVLRNKSSKGVEGIAIGTEDAEHALTLFLRVLEWFYGEGPGTPRLAHIYTRDTRGAETVQTQLRRLEALLTSGAPRATTDLAGVPASRTALGEHLRTYVTSMLAWPQLGAVGRHDLELTARGPSGPEPLARLRQTGDRVIITGPPGGGKTVFLLRTFEAFCRRLQASLEANEEELAVPLYLELGGFTRQQSLPELILSRLGLEGGSQPLAALQRLLGQCSLVLQLDGFNELPEDERSPCAHRLIDFDQQLRARGLHRRVRIFLTTRPYGFRNYFEPHGYQLVEILPLTLKEIKARFAARLGPPLTRSVADVFKQLGPNLRHLLSNPQHLTYAIEWYVDHLHASEDGRRAVCSRGALLHHCISKKLERFEPGLVKAGEGLLKRIAYDASDGTVHFSAERVLEQALATPELALAPHPPAVVIEKLLHAGLLTVAGDRLRFPHHSDQQYFAACEMKRRWELDEYTGHELWHEPLVVLAGLLEEDRLQELLSRVRDNQPLYAYVIANVDQPELAQEFQLRALRDFTERVRRYARGLGRLLLGPFIAWFAFLLALGYLGAVFDPGNLPKWLDYLAALAGLAYVFAFPYAIVMWQRRRFARNSDRLRSKDLPRLIATLRYLDSYGALQTLASELRVLHFELTCLPEDPRASFFAEAIERVQEALVTRSYLTEDEMLAQIDNPLAAASLEVEALNADQIEVLCRRTADAEEGPAAYNSLFKLKEVYSKNVDHRERIARMLLHLALDPRASRRMRQLAIDACQSLGIALPFTGPKRSSGKRAKLAVTILSAVLLVVLCACLLIRLFSE